MAQYHPPLDSLPPRPLLLHHRLILMVSGTVNQMGWIFIAMGSMVGSVFFLVATTQAETAVDMIWPALLCLIFPLIGGILVGITLKQNFKAIDLITNGKFARGKVVSKTPTNVKINEQTVYAYSVEFTADNGRSYTVTGKTHHTHLVEDEPEERVLYLPSDPAWGMVFDTIPNAPTFDANGNLLPPNWLRLSLLVLPVLGLFTLLGLLSSLVTAINFLL